MGYPMTYQRVVGRNRLTRPDYWDGKAVEQPLSAPQLIGNISGDLRRLERDSRDELQLALYAKKTGLTPEQVKSVLDAFFDSDYAGIEHNVWQPVKAAS